MKKNYQKILLLYLMLALSACPYIPVYKGITQTKSDDSLKITPLDFFYNSRKGLATCSAGLRFYNQKDSIQKIDFSNSHLINSTDTLKIGKIWALGVPFESYHIFYLPPKKDTILGFYFKDLERNFGDTIKLVLNISNVRNDTFIYKRIR